MSVPVLTLLKLFLLLLLYLFLLRVLVTIRADVYGSNRRVKAPPPRPAVADPQPRKPRRAPRELVVHPPEGRPEVVRLGEDTITLGRREPATIIVDDGYVSDEHAAIVPAEDGVWLVRDLGSTNGTYLNGAKVTQPTPLAAGDQVRVGKTRIELRR